MAIKYFEKLSINKSSFKSNNGIDGEVEKKENIEIDNVLKSEEGDDLVQHEDATKHGGM